MLTIQIKFSDNHKIIGKAKIMSWGHKTKTVEVLSNTRSHIEDLVKNACKDWHEKCDTLICGTLPNSDLVFIVN